MKSILRKIARLFIPIIYLVYRLSVRLRSVWNYLYSVWVSNTFHECGNSVYFGQIGELRGKKYISIGEKTIFGRGVFLTAWDTYIAGSDCQRFTPEIKIGRNCCFGAYNHITAIDRIEIGDGCLTGKWITITDNSHCQSDFDSLYDPPIKRKLYSKGAVIIGKNVWIGDKATILPGVTIGDGAVIAANAVVTQNAPAYSVVAGVHAQIIKQQLLSK